MVILTTDSHTDGLILEPVRLIVPDERDQRYNTHSAILSPYRFIKACAEVLYQIVSVGLFVSLRQSTHLPVWKSTCFAFTYNFATFFRKIVYVLFEGNSNTNNTNNRISREVHKAVAPPPENPGKI